MEIVDIIQLLLVVAIVKFLVEGLVCFGGMEFRKEVGLFQHGSDQAVVQILIEIEVWIRIGEGVLLEVDCELAGGWEVHEVGSESIETVDVVGHCKAFVTNITVEV